MNSTVITAVVSLIGILTVGVLVPIYLIGRAEKTRRTENAEAEQLRREEKAEAARLHREDRDAEWARQDAVAAKAAQTATDLAASQKLIADKADEAAALLINNGERVAQSQEETNGRLDIIHKLVNSQMTAALQSEYDAIKRELAMMREVVELRRNLGTDPTKESLREIIETEKKLTELGAKLSDRQKAQDQADE